MRHPSRYALVILASMPGFLPGIALGQYPNKPIRFIVPFAPGGGTDLIARVVAQRLNESYGWTLIVDNRPGAGSSLGTELAVKSAPDGYTMVLNSISLAFNVSLFEKLPFDPMTDLAPVSMVATQPNVLAANPRVQAASIKELISLSKQKPGAMSYASGGSGSGPHLATELLKMMAAIDLVHVPYKGTGPALTDLIGGQVDVMVAVIASALPQIRAGRLRAIAVTGPSRAAVMPEVPTLSESGVPGYEFTTWYGVQMPAKASPVVVGQMNRNLAQVLERREVRDQFAAAGLEPQPSTPEDFRRLVQSEIAKWERVVKESKVLVD